MPAWHHRRFGDGRRVLVYLAVLGLAFLYFLHRFHADFSGLRPFWDARVYARALAAWRGGLNPYASATSGETGLSLPFVSPPVFLPAIGALSHILPGRVGFALYCALASVSAVAVPTVFAAFYLRSRWMTASLAVFLTWFLPGKYGSQAVLTGNVSNVLYAALLAAGVPGVRRNQWLPFYVVVALAGLLKPPFLAFLVLPLLAGDRQWLQSSGVVLVVLAGDLVQKMIMPGSWDEFQRSVYLRVFVRGDAGFGVLGQLMALGVHVPVLRRLSPTMEYALVVTPLVALAAGLRKRRWGGPAERMWVPFLAVLAVLSNPRVLDYDANVAVVPAAFLAVEFFRSLPAGPLRGLQIGIPVAVFLGLESSNADEGLCFLLVMSVLMVLCQLLWPGYFEGPEGDAIPEHPGQGAVG